MLVDDLEQLKDWLTASLSPICEADPSALAKYIVALVKKDKPLSDLKDSCTDQLDVFLQTKTKDFVDTLFEVIENKSYMVKKEEAPPAPDQLPDSVPEVPPTENDATPTSSDQQLVTSTSKIDIKKEEELQKAFPIVEKRPLKSRSRSISPRTRSREEDRRRRLDDRRNFDRGYQRRRSTSPRLRRYRSRSPYRRRSPFRPVRRSRSPGPRGRGRGRSRSRSWSRSWSRSPRSRSRERMRSRSPGGRIRSRSPGGRIRSRSPGGRIRSRSPGGRIRSRSPGGRIRSRSPGGRIRSRSPNGRIRSRSPGGRIRSRSPGGRVRSRSPGGRSPRREVRARSPRGRSPYRRSVSPRFRSRSPRKRSRSPAGSKSPRSRSSFSPNRSRSRSPLRKVHRNSQDSRGPTPTQENGLADSTNPTPTDSHSSISVVTHTSGRYGEVQSASRIRCRDYDDVWIIGDSIPYWAGVYAITSGRPNLKIDDMTIAWFGKQGLGWNSLRDHIQNQVLPAIPPSIIVLHLGGDDLINIKTPSLWEIIQNEITYLRESFPETLLVWMDILQRQKWEGAQGPDKGIEKKRKRINQIGRKIVLSSGNGDMVSPDIGAKTAFYHPDGVHLNSVGIEFYFHHIKDIILKHKTRVQRQ